MKQLKAEHWNTIRAMAESDMRPSKAALVLGVHPHTVYFRMDRILEITGLDPRSFRDLCKLVGLMEEMQISCHNICDDFGQGREEEPE